MEQVKTCFVGIDLTSSPEKPSAYALLADNLEIQLDFLQSDQELVETATQNQPAVVAIDAPLGLPWGTCCLEESCSCRPLSKLAGRECERELARRGISCFFTTKKSIIKLMVYRAISLKEKLLAQGPEVIEIYPYASRVCLWGRPKSSKLKSEGLNFLREELTKLIPALASKKETLDHNLCDAILAAYTARLFYHGEAQALGEPTEGQILIPQKPSLSKVPTKVLPGRERV